VENLPYIICTK